MHLFRRLLFAGLISGKGIRGIIYGKEFCVSEKFGYNIFCLGGMLHQKNFTPNVLRGEIL